MGFNRRRLIRLEEAAAARLGRPRRVEDLPDAALLAIASRDAGRPDGVRRSAADYSDEELQKIVEQGEAITEGQRT
jgi:hypothetical protein